MNTRFLRYGIFVLLALSLHCHAYRLDFIPVTIKSPAYTINVSGIAQSETGDIQIDLVLENTSTTEIVIDHSSLELVTSQGWRAPLIAEENEPSNKVATQTKQHFTFKFQPINSMELYQLLKIPGDFEPQYTLNIPLLSEHQPLSPLSLAFTNKAYQGYIEQAGQERTLNLHLPTINASEFITQQSAHMKKNFAEEYPEQVSIIALPQQTVINGQVFQWRAYQQQGKLVISMQIVNHNRRDIILDTAGFAVELGDKTYLPSNNFLSLPTYMHSDIVENTNSKQYRIKAGKRFSWIFNYDTPFRATPLMLNLTGVQVANKPLFSQKLSFAPAQGLADFTHTPSPQPSP